MKRIALFVGSLQKGGSERVMVNLAEYFHAKGYEVLLVTQYKREIEYDISPDIKRVYSEPAPELVQGNRLHNFKVRYDTLRNIWKEFKPDLVLSFIGKNNFMTIMTSYKMPHKVAVSVRADPKMEYPGKLNRLLVRWLFPKANLVILQTTQSIKFFTDINKKINALVLPNPLNPIFLETTPASEKDDIIIATGRLDENKNHEMLIRAFAKIEKDFPTMKLMICGQGDLNEYLHNLCKELKIEDKVLMPGSVSDVAERVNRARILSLTSYTEGMPNSIMEAMALGTVVVSTDCPCGGPAEIIQDGENGLLVPVGDADALADAFRKVLSDKEFEKKLQRNALNIRKDFHPDNVNKKWEETFWSLFM